MSSLVPRSRPTIVLSAGESAELAKLRLFGAELTPYVLRPHDRRHRYTLGVWHKLEAKGLLTISPGEGEGVWLGSLVPDRT